MTDTSTEYDPTRYPAFAVTVDVAPFTTEGRAAMSILGWDVPLVYRIALTTKAFARQRIIAWIDRYNRTPA